MLEQDKIHEMDCFTAMTQIPDESVDLFLSDPPYPNGMKLFQDQIIDGYAALYYACKKTKGLVAFFWNASDVPEPPRGWYEVARHVWHKPDCRTITHYEVIVVWSKDWKRLTSKVWSIPILDYRSLKDWKPHPTQKPVRLIRYILDLYTKEGDVVLDPFVGSGTTAVACKQMQRHFIAVEKNPEYARIAQERLAQTGSYDARREAAREPDKEMPTDNEPEDPPGTPAPPPYRQNAKPLTRAHHKKASSLATNSPPPAPQE